MNYGFAISYELVSEFSAEHGDREHGDMIEESLSLREAVEHLDDVLSRYNHNGIVESDSWPCINPRWLTFYGEYENGVQWNFSLHLPMELTTATRLRIARFFECSGLPRK